MVRIDLSGKNAEQAKATLQKKFNMKWSRTTKTLYRSKLEKQELKKIMNYCMKHKINYKTDDGQSYEVIPSEVIETSNRELREWGDSVSRPPSSSSDDDHEQQWSE